jgi:hypothetical protein
VGLAGHNQLAAPRWPVVVSVVRGVFVHGMVLFFGFV